MKHLNLSSNKISALNDFLQIAKTSKLVALGLGNNPIELGNLVKFIKELEHTSIEQIGLARTCIENEAVGVVATAINGTNITCLDLS